MAPTLCPGTSDAGDDSRVPDNETTMHKGRADRGQRTDVCAACVCLPNVPTAAARIAGQTDHRCVTWVNAGKAAPRRWDGALAVHQQDMVLRGHVAVGWVGAEHVHSQRHAPTESAVGRNVPQRVGVADKSIEASVLADRMPVPGRTAHFGVDGAHKALGVDVACGADLEVGVAVWGRRQGRVHTSE